MRKRPDVVRDLRTVTPCMKIGDVATLECWLNDMLGRSLSRVRSMRILSHIHSFILRDWMYDVLGGLFQGIIKALVGYKL